MRIYGNRQLKTLPGSATRPTSARVREALFNIWREEIEDCRWLDICAGNGSMGAEALCRGASEVVGIEKNGKACTIIKDNWQQVSQPEQKFKILRGDAIAKLKSLTEEQFDFIYFDPPYNSYLYLPVLKAIADYQLLSSTGKIAVEHNFQLWQAAEVSGLQISRAKTYGNTTLTFYLGN